MEQEYWGFFDRKCIPNTIPPLLFKWYFFCLNDTELYLSIRIFQKRSYIFFFVYFYLIQEDFNTQNMFKKKKQGKDCFCMLTLGILSPLQNLCPIFLTVYMNALLYLSHDIYLETTNLKLLMQRKRIECFCIIKKKKKRSLLVFSFDKIRKRMKSIQKR